MDVWVKRGCPKCGAVVEGWQRAYVALGPPFVSCSGCRTTLRVSHQNEWDYLRGWQRTRFVVGFLWTILTWAFAGGVLLPLVLAVGYIVCFGSGRQSVGDVLDQYHTVVGWPLTVVGAGAAVYQLRQRIAESRARLRDPSYRAQVEHVASMH
jgi:hypothetical protein